MKIVAIVGSPRAAGNASYLVDQALDEAGKLGMTTEKIMLGQYEIQPCSAHDNCGEQAQCPQKDDAARVLEEFYDADGVILASPVYYFNVSALMKLFMDRNRFNRRRGMVPKARSAGLIAVAASSGLEPTLDAMRHFVRLTRARVAPEKILTVSGLSNRLGDVKVKPPLVEEARRLGRQMAEQLS
ncbi:MAG: flavodoxin family protein [Chloroflexota bacterium]|nr:flavodoxin family protein [Chloroflexota bacterium]